MGSFYNAELVKIRKKSDVGCKFFHVATTLQLPLFLPLVAETKTIFVRFISTDRNRLHVMHEYTDP